MKKYYLITVATFILHTNMALSENQEYLSFQNKILNTNQYVDVLLNKIDKQSPLFHHQGLNAFISLNRRIHQDIDNATGPYHGIPIVVKDNIDVKGMATTAGTPAFRNNFPKSDAAVIKLLKEKGFVILGKTNLHELAAGVTSDNYFYGPVRNPYNLKFFAGGSSGGTAAAIAAGLAPIGLGSDTAGSVRIPAALCGIVGFRPSLGRYSTKGVVPVSKLLDTVGIMANNVHDISVLDGILSKSSKKQPLLLTNNTIRLGIPTNYFFDNLDPEVAKIISKALKHLRENNIILVPIEMHDLGNLTQKAAFPIAFHDAKVSLTVYLKQRKIKLNINELINKIKSPDVKKSFTKIISNPVNLKSYYKAIYEARPKLQKLYRKTFFNYQIDAIAFPTTPQVSKSIAEAKEISVNQYARNTIPAANAGVPGITIPIGLTRNGLPVGMELDGKYGEDRELLAIAEKIEGALKNQFSPTRNKNVGL